MNRASLTLGLAAMDTCWLYPWCVLIGPWAIWSEPARGGPVLSATTLLGLLLVGAFSTQVLGRRFARTQATRFGLAAFAAIAALVAVRADHYPSSGAVDWLGPLLGALAVAIGQLSAPVVAFALALYVWWRGVRLGSQTSSFTEVEGAFRWGIGRLVVFGLILAISTRPSALPLLESQTTPFVVGFFFFSLITLALGRLESLRTRTRTVGVNSQWFGVLLIVAASVVTIALLLGQLVSFDVLTLATRPLFDLLGQLLLLAAYALVIPLAYIVEWLIYLVLSLLRDNTNQPPPQPLQPSDVNTMLARLLSELVPPEVLFALKAAGAALLVGLALFLVARSLSRWRASGADADATNEERDSLWDASHMRARLLAWLRRLLRRASPAALGGLASVETSTPPTRAPLQSSVRELYVQLLRLGEAAGARRAHSTTPLEHAPALVAMLEPHQAVGDLTDAYLRARYAEAEPSVAEAAALREQLERMRLKGATD
jgi:hypothetical protein